MNISSIRLGHANNSSSTHSILLNSPSRSKSGIVENFQYGWEWFHLKHKDDKAMYLAALIFTTLQREMSAEHAAVIAHSLTGMDPLQNREKDKYWSVYVDHQSVNAFPLEFGGEHYDSQFMREFVEYIRDTPEITIRGGNDNVEDRGESERSTATGEESILNSLPRDCSKIKLFSKKDGDWWILYNKETGAKLRVSFGKEPKPYTHSSRPELVDIKITDYCPYGCKFCLAPDTRVLHEDMTWHPIGEAKVGDVLVGFDEHAAEGSKRKYRRSAIQAISRSKKPVYRIKTKMRSILATGNHGWLVYRTALSGQKVWYSTDQLKAGKHALAFVSNPVSVNESRDYKAGYIVGMTMGDGTFNYKPEYMDKSRSELAGMQLWWRVAVTDFEIIDRLDDYLKTFGVEAVVGDFYEGSETHRPAKKIETRKKAYLEIIHSLIHAPKETDDYKRGFVAGFYDAEGNDGDSLRVAQKKDMSKLDLFVRYAKDIGFSFDMEDYGSCPTARLIGDVEDRMRFYAIVRPAISRKMAYWDGCEASMIPEEILSVEPAGEMDVVDIQTSSATFVAEGLATHNCYQDSTKGGKHAPLGILQQIAYNCREAKVFEVALGGGETTQHPQFTEVLKAFGWNGVTPNFTTFNMVWANNKDMVEAVEKFCRSFAVSDPYSIKQIARWNDDHPYGYVDRTGIKATLQLPLGCYENKVIVKALDGASALNVPVTLLGFKNHGRGEQVLPTDASWIIDYLVKSDSFHAFGADSVFVEQFKDQLKSAGISPKLMVNKEGAYSCYIDAVTSQAGASSYTKELHPLDLGKPFERFPYAA